MPTIHVPTNVPDEMKPIPAGEWEVEITEAPEVKENYSKDGQVMVVTMKILDDGEFQGRTLVDRLSVTSTKMFPQVKLKNLLVAGGQGTWDSGSESWTVPAECLSEELVGRTFRVITKPDSYIRDGVEVPTIRVDKYVAPVHE